MKSRLFVLCFLILTLGIIQQDLAYANSAEPPLLILRVENAPADLKIDASQSNVSASSVNKRLFETSFLFFKYDLPVTDDLVIALSSASGSYSIVIPNSLITGYNSLVTLDYKERIFIQGAKPYREPLLIALRVLLTLCIEGFIFWQFEFRAKRSWVIFLTLNLLTQGWLNVELGRASSAYQAYLLLGLILMEAIILIVESIGLTLLLNEHSKLRRFFYALTANISSFALGFYILSVLPI